MKQHLFNNTKAEAIAQSPEEMKLTLEGAKDEKLGAVSHRQGDEDGR